MRLLGIFVLSLLLQGCGKPKDEGLLIGTIAGPETELVEVAQEKAEQKYGLKVKIIEFNDYNLPNEALQDGSLDANIYQHLPYLTAAIKDRHYDFAVLGKTFVYPTGIYSQKHRNLAELKKSALIAIPNDPSNEARALLLLEKAGLIQLKTSSNPGLKDISSNPKALQFKALDAAQLPRVLADVDAAVINTNFAIPAGLSPSRDSLFVEDKNSPYANLIVIRKDTAKRTELELFVKALHSKEVLAKAKSLFGEAAVPAW